MSDSGVSVYKHQKIESLQIIDFEQSELDRIDKKEYVHQRGASLKGNV